MSDAPLTPERRTEVIGHADAMADYYEAEWRLFWALWQRDSDFDHKAAYDLALSNWNTVRRLRDSLIQGAK